jgi:hypothetical protein
MGFRLDRTYRLVFEDYPQLDGFEVVIKATPAEMVIRMRGLPLNDGGESIAELLAEYVLSWNYTDEAGEVLPVTAASFMSLEQSLLATISREWYYAAVGISAPLERTSIDTSSPELESIPTTDVL